jgi:hypothetical protein
MVTMAARQLGSMIDAAPDAASPPQSMTSLRSA